MYFPPQGIEADHTIEGVVIPIFSFFKGIPLLKNYLPKILTSTDGFLFKGFTIKAPLIYQYKDLEK